MELIRELLPDAGKLLQALTTRLIPRAIATTGKLKLVKKDLQSLDIELRKAPVITSDDVVDGNLEPDVIIKRSSTVSSSSTGSRRPAGGL